MVETKGLKFNFAKCILFVLFGTVDIVDDGSSSPFAVGNLSSFSIILTTLGDISSLSTISVRETLSSLLSTNDASC